MGELFWWGQRFWKRNKHAVSLSSIVKNHEVLLQKRRDLNSMLSLAGLFSFSRNSSIKESITRVCTFILIAQLMAHNSSVLTKWEAKSEKPLQSPPFFFPLSPHPNYDGVLAKGRREPKRKRVKGRSPGKYTLTGLFQPYNSLIYIIRSTTFFGHAVVPPSPVHLSPIVFSNPSLIYQPETQVSGFVACFSLQDVFPCGF